MYTPVSTSQPAASDQLQVVIPANAKVGDMLSVTAPNGQMLQFAIPEGATVGQTLMIPIPAQPQVQNIEMQHISNQVSIPTSAERPPRFIKEGPTSSSVLGISVSVEQKEKLNPEVCFVLKGETGNSGCNNFEIISNILSSRPDNAHISSRINTVEWEALCNDVKSTEEKVMDEHPKTVIMLKYSLMIGFVCFIISAILSFIISNYIVGFVLILILFLIYFFGFNKLSKRYVEDRDNAIANTLAKHNKNVLMPKGLAIMYRQESVRVHSGGSEGGSRIVIQHFFVINIAHPANMAGMTSFIEHYFLNQFPTAEYVGPAAVPNIVVNLDTVCSHV